MYLATGSLALLLLWVTARGEALLNADGSITLPNKSVKISEDQMELTLTTNIILPADTMSVGKVIVSVFSADDRGGQLTSRLANTSGITQASPKAQKVRELGLENASITLTSKVWKNLPTNRFQVGSELKIRLNGSTTLYQHVFQIRKVLIVVTSWGKLGKADVRHNEQLFFIFYTKSVGTATPISTFTPFTGLTSQENDTTHKPSVTDATTSGTKNKVVIGVWIGIGAVILIVMIGCGVYCKCERNRRHTDAKKITEPSTEEGVEPGAITNNGVFPL